MVGVAARIVVEDGTATSARVAATGVADRPIRLRAVENALVDADTDDAEASGDAATHATQDLDDEQVRGDHHASAAYRTHLLPVYVERTLQTALDRATAGTGGEQA